MLRRIARVLIVLLLVAIMTGVVVVYSLTRSGLAQLDGKATLPGLSAGVVVERDDHGVPRIRAENGADAFRALGFLHAQERYFQMDLLRRSAAGELAEIFGEAAAGADARMRVHRLRARALRALGTADAGDLAELTAYVEGVNAGLDQAGRPFEYVLLRQQPAPWRDEDPLLVVYAMYLDLNDENAWRDRQRGVMRDTLHPALVEFLLPAGSEDDAPLIGDALETPPIPGPEQVDLRAGDTPALRSNARSLERPVEAAPIIGSNNWAVDATVSSDGRAWVANDMHLGLGMPNIWYRASLQWTGDDGKPRRVSGVTLPGVLGVVAGSTDWIAWGFTNSQIDLSDLIELEPVDGDPTRYLTPEGDRSIEEIEETIVVQGGEPRTLTVEETIWGPIVHRGPEGKRYVSRWVGHDTGNVDYSLGGLAEAHTLEQALAIAHAAGIPAQNFVAATADGRIGWTLAGPIPDRFGHDGRFPASWSDGKRGWNGMLDPDRVPRLIDPPSGRLWTANNRTVDGEQLTRLGFGGYAHGARAKQIRDGLMAREALDPQDLLDIQLDDRALFFERWYTLLRSVVRERTLKLSLPDWDELERQLDATWTGHASVDSVAYRMVRTWRQYVAKLAFDPLVAPCLEADGDFNYRRFSRYEGPLWKMLSERPIHLLDPSYASWEELLVAAVDELLDSYLNEETKTLDAFTWGDGNRVVVAHPMSRFLPGFLARRFDIPTEPLPGDSRMPRVQSRFWGASERFVVSPGNFDASLFHMPGGQSGHPFSPYYRKGHRAWAEGLPTPFLPGETKHTLVLEPSR